MGGMKEGWSIMKANCIWFYIKLVTFIKPQGFKISLSRLVILENGPLDFHLNFNLHVEDLLEEDG